MSENQSLAIHWRLNSLCNRECPFCYGPNGIDEAPLSSAYLVMDKLLAYGIDSFIITGGEPTLSKNLDAILEYLKAHGAKVALYSNCDLWERKARVLEKCLDTLCVPLEGATALTHDKQRGRGSFRTIRRVLDRWATGSGPFKIKVGTVLGRHNSQELPALQYLIDKYRVEVWKIYEYVPYTDRPLQAKWESNSQGLTAAEFRTATQGVVRTPGRRTTVSVSGVVDRSESYLMLNPDLSVIVPVQTAAGTFVDRYLGSAISLTISEIEVNWREVVDVDRYRDNLRASHF